MPRQTAQKSNAIRKRMAITSYQCCDGIIEKPSSRFITGTLIFVYFLDAAQLVML
jgi:hypothetical protein